MGTVRRGDGSSLRPVTGMQWLWRGQFGVECETTTYVLDVNYFDLDEKGHLYEDGTQVAVAPLPAKFPVPGGQIEADMSLYGMKRAHFVSARDTRQLIPLQGTAERWRMDLDRSRPVLSRRLALASVVILFVALLIELPQLLQLLTTSDWFHVLTGWSFTAPFTLPRWLNGALSVAGVIAGLERALRLQHHWLLDE